MRKQVAIISLLLVLSLGAATQEENADAVILELVKEYCLNDDGSMEVRIIKEQQLLSHFAFHSLYGETFIIYNPIHQELIINEAYTTMADGKKVVTPRNAFNEVLPRFAANFPAMNHLREMVVTHTGLEVGATIHLDYTIRTEAGYFPALMAQEILVSNCPVNRQVLRVDVPSGTELHHKTFNIRTAPEITEGNGRKTFTWIFSPLPPRALEAYQPDDVDHLPAVVFSTGKDLFQTISALTSQNAFHDGLSQEMTDRTGRIRESDNSGVRTILDIQKLVVEELNLFDVPLEYSGYQIRTPSEVWESNGGTEAEKAVLLSTLLNQAGFKANVHAVYPSKVLDEAVGCLQSIKGFIVEADAGETGKIFLSPSRLHDQNLYFEYGGQTLVLLDPEVESLKTTEIPEQLSLLKADFNLELTSDKAISGTIHATFGSSFNPYPGMLKDSVLLKNMWTAFAAGGQVEEFKVTSRSADRSEVVYEIGHPSPLKERQDYLFLELPVFKNGFHALQISYLSTSRKAPFRIPYPFSEQYIYTLQLPDNYVLVTGTHETEITGTAGAVTITIRQRGTVVTVTRSITFPARMIDPIHYSDLRILANEWNDMNKKQLVFRIMK